MKDVMHNDYENEMKREESERGAVGGDYPIRWRRERRYNYIFALCDHSLTDSC